MLVSGCPTAGPRCSAAEASCTATALPASIQAQRSSRSSRPLPARALLQHAAGASSSSSGRRGLTLRPRAAEVSSDMQQPQSLGDKGVPTADTWELDFCSRPILDERGKKLWELIICDPTRSFEYSQYFPNNRINSTQLKAAIEGLLAQPGATRPERCRFFRGQMQTIITTALMELNIQAVPSRRCFALSGWLEERVESVYRSHPGYSEKQGTLFTLDLDTPQDLPDALRGESWCFVQLPLADLQAELDELFKTGEQFGDRFPLSAVGAGELPPNTLVPGLCVFSRRALPLAAWTNGLELAALKADTDRACLILETGVNQRWRYGAYRRSPEATAEAQAWEETKDAIGGLHFLAIQENEESDVCGMWLLADQPPPNI